MEKTKEILTIAGTRVEVRLCEKGPCDKCCFFSHDCGCPYDMPCFPYWGPDYFAYFVPAKESADRWVVTNAFLKCEKAGKIVSEMYGGKFNNQRNRDKYLAFLQQVNLDDRFGELAGILQRYGAMPARKEQPEADLGARMLAHFRKKTKPTWCNIAVKDIIDYLEGVSVTKEIDFEEAVYKAFGQVKDFTLAIRIARYFYNLNPKHNK